MVCRLKQWHVTICMGGAAGLGIKWTKLTSFTWLKYLKTPKSIWPNPILAYRHTHTDKLGEFSTRPKVLSEDQPVEVRQLITYPDTHFQRFPVRNTERGVLDDRFAMRRIWTIRDDELAEEWLVIRHENDERYTYALSNAPADTTLERLAWLKCVRHFVERSNQDAKSEIGWDELQAQKFRAWEHHLAMTIMATWFIAETKYDWAQHLRSRSSVGPGIGSEGFASSVGRERARIAAGNHALASTFA